MEFFVFFSPRERQKDDTERNKTEKVETTTLQKHLPKNIQPEHPFEAEQIFAHQIELFADEILS